ncbi:MAG: aminomethyltransferase family protein [Caldilineaceae bacterium]|nr:aminomethyltransferase family protein [Caldilineaceae bacterium]
METATMDAQYVALTKGAAFQLRPTGGVLRMTDDDRIDFLQRMTTNNMAALTPGTSAVTILTSPVARSLFVFTVVCEHDALLLLPALGETEVLLKHLRGQIFFMDKVKIEDVSAHYARLRIMGPEARSTLMDLGYEASSADGAVEAVNDVILVHQSEYDLPGYEVLVPTDARAEFLNALMEHGAQRLDDGLAYTARRIELGRPLPDAEISSESNPLESGMGWACADNKGCYTGQEIIARQITYDKVTKTLVGLRSEQLLEAGADVTVEGRSVGEVTSAGHSPALGAPVALAIIKRPHNAPGSAVKAGGVKAEVVELPFVAV